MTPSDPTIAVFGAGLVGCYVGGRLAHAGARVVLIGRERTGRALQARGLRVSALDGTDLYLPPDRCTFVTDARDASPADLVLVCVKSAATASAGAAIAALLKPQAVVLSLQNGMHNTDALRAALPGRGVLAGVVEFNVVQPDDAHVHQASAGRLHAQHDAVLAGWQGLFARAGVPLALHADIAAVQWAKLQLNLNNAINALSGLPLKDELAQRAYRRCLAMAQRELLAALDAAGITPARLTPVPPRWMPRLLELPDLAFRVVARRTLAIDPLARSSTADDLRAGRATEVGELNGEVVRLAAAVGRTAPANAQLVEFVRAAEREGLRPWSGDELLAALRRAGG